MPLEGAPLAEYCGGPASLCVAVKSDCSECNSIHRELAGKRRQEGKKITEEFK